jgi:hypothetical protein
MMPKYISGIGGTGFGGGRVLLILSVGRLVITDAPTRPGSKVSGILPIRNIELL